MTRQLDPADPAFLPPLGMHLVLSARDRTQLALPGRSRRGWVDPLGWAGMAAGPAISIWFADGAESSDNLPWDASSSVSDRISPAASTDRTGPSGLTYMGTTNPPHESSGSTGGQAQDAVTGILPVVAGGTIQE